MADMAKSGESRSKGRPVLVRWVEQLEELLFRLDGFILHRAAQPLDRGESNSSGIQDGRS